MWKIPVNYKQLTIYKTANYNRTVPQYVQTINQNISSIIPTIGTSHKISWYIN